MQNPNNDILDQASRSWIEASKRLGIEVTAPYVVKVGGDSVQCLAFLPHFGKQNGMFVAPMLPPKFETDSRLVEFAKSKELFYSFVNPLGWTTFDENGFKEVLEDWGYFGPVNKCPTWYRGYNYTQIRIMHSQILNAWSEASQSLGIRFVASLHELTGKRGFIGFLPEFGSSKGMLLGAIYPPKYDKDPSVEDVAAQKGMFCSCLHAPDYIAYEAAIFKKALREWGYFGSSETRPGWL